MDFEFLHIYHTLPNKMLSYYIPVEIDKHKENTP